MTTDDDVSDAEIDGAIDDDAAVVLRRGREASIRGPSGLVQIVQVDVTPTTRLLDAVAEALARIADETDEG